MCGIKLEGKVHCPLNVNKEKKMYKKLAVRPQCIPTDVHKYPNCRKATQLYPYNKVTECLFALKDLTNR